MQFSLFTTVLATLAASVAAYTTPTEGPVGNPIGSPLEGEIVPVGKPYTIVWKPDTPESTTVSIILLRGPSTNVQPMYPLGEKLPNTGSFIWTPAADLESDTTHYAVQLIEDATGRFQWGMQFGIDNPAVPKGGKGDQVTTTTLTTTAAGGDDDDVTTTITATSTSTAVVTVTGTRPTETETETETEEPETSTVVETTSRPSNLTTTKITSTTRAPTTILSSTTAASNATASETKPSVPTKTDDEEGAAAKFGSSIAIVAVAAAAFAFF